MLRNSGHVATSWVMISEPLYQLVVLFWGCKALNPKTFEKKKTHSSKSRMLMAGLCKQVQWKTLLGDTAPKKK